MKLADIRKEYSSKSLDINRMNSNALEQFKSWLKEAIRAEVNEPNAMHLCTIKSDNTPSGRIVLLKGVDVGFVFFTNYKSHKGMELSANPYASITFFWPELERQVRIEGRVEKTDAKESDEYFLSRPLESQIGAWSSPQSQIIPNRKFLENKKTEMENRFKNEPLKRPDYWGGFRLKARNIEFWQGRPGRLHDRVKYQLDEGGNWIMSLLAP
ncbi:MAG: pyridoxamine 5'-phosphate oxidase [Cyclobacteriaceae bacterium]